MPPIHLAQQAEGGREKSKISKVLKLTDSGGGARHDNDQHHQGSTENLSNIFTEQVEVQSSV
jgi:hypothetical protein